MRKYNTVVVAVAMVLVALILAPSGQAEALRQLRSPGSAKKEVNSTAGAVVSYTFPANLNVCKFTISSQNQAQFRIAFGASDIAGGIYEVPTAGYPSPTYATAAGLTVYLQSNQDTDLNGGGAGVDTLAISYWLC